MRDRLIELLQEASAEAGKHFRETTKKVLAEKGRFNSKEDIDCRNIYEVEADHLLANGVIVPPCKVGDKVYVVDYTRLGNMIFECEIEEISHFSYGTYYYLNWGLHIPRFKACQENSFGKTVFLTREEAEQALKEGKAE